MHVQCCVGYGAVLEVLVGGHGSKWWMTWALHRRQTTAWVEDNPADGFGTVIGLGEGAGMGYRGVVCSGISSRARCAWNSITGRRSGPWECSPQLIKVSVS